MVLLKLFIHRVYLNKRSIQNLKIIQILQFYRNNYIPSENCLIPTYIIYIYVQCCRLDSFRVNFSEIQLMPCGALLSLHNYNAQLKEIPENRKTV